MAYTTPLVAISYVRLSRSDLSIDVYGLDRARRIDTVQSARTPPHLIHASAGGTDVLS